MFSEGRVLVTKVSQLGWHVVSALAAGRFLAGAIWPVAHAKSAESPHSVGKAQM
jgi:hypothetical protein